MGNATRRHLSRLHRFVRQRVPAPYPAARRCLVAVRAIVQTSPELDAVDWNVEQHLVQDLPDDVLVYTLPSRYCLSDVLVDRAAQLFGSAPRGRGCVQAICDWVNAHVTFIAGTSSPLTTSVDVFESGRGVCRDYAHLAITFCRAMNIPARYAFGYLPDLDVPPPYPMMDFCAWFEAYLGGMWWTFTRATTSHARGAFASRSGAMPWTWPWSQPMAPRNSIL